MNPHPDEVDDVKWVTPEEMDEMMDNQGKSMSLSGSTPFGVCMDVIFSSPNSPRAVSSV